MKLNKLFLIDRKLVKCSQSRKVIKVIDLHGGITVIDKYGDQAFAAMIFQETDENIIVEMLSKRTMILDKTRSRYILSLN
ncbi:MAG: hypothetical protein ACFB2Y_02680 [Fulvivirga sp.]